MIPRARSKGFTSLVLVCLVLGGLPIPRLAFGYTANNVDPIAHVGGPARRVTVEGNYAYFCVGDQLHIAHYDGPGRVSVVSMCVLPGQCRDVAVENGYAYVAAGPAGLFIVHVGDPAHPSHITTVPCNCGGVDVEGNYAYIIAGSLGVVDISNPAKPGAIVGVTGTAGAAYHPCVRNGRVYFGDYYQSERRFVVVNAQTPSAPFVEGFVTNVGGGLYDVALKDNYAFAPSIYYGLQVFDVSNPTTPTLAKRFTSFDAFSLAVSGNYLYLQGDLLWVWNVTTPTIPTVVLNNWPGVVGDKFSITGLAAGGSTLYAGCGRAAGVRIVNISDPSSPTVGMTYPLPGHSNVVGAKDDCAYLFEGSELQTVNTDPDHFILRRMNLGAVGKRLAVEGNCLWVAQGHPGFSLFDISTATSPTRITDVNLVSTANDVAAFGSLLAVATTSGTLLYNIATPASPTYLGQAPQNTARVTFCKPTVLAAGIPAGVNLYNVANPTSPVTLSTIPTGTVSALVAWDSYYLAVTRSTGLGRIYIINDPSSPVLVGTIPSSTQAPGLAYRDRVLFVASTWSGCRCIACYNPRLPSEFGYFDPDTYVYGLTAPGNDRVFVSSVGSGAGGAADQDQGLWVIAIGQRPDLTIQDFDFSPDVIQDSGGSLSLHGTLRNAPDAAIDTPFCLAVLGSPSKDFSPPYTTLTAPVLISSLGPNGSLALDTYMPSVYFGAPGGVPQGRYYVGLRCDSTDVVLEHSEYNNLAMVLDRPVQIGSFVPVCAAEPAYTRGTSNTISWYPIMGATGYYLEWSASPTFTPAVGNSGWTSSTLRAATGLQNGQVYYYRVKCRIPGGGESGWSNAVSSTQDTSLPTAPGTPTDAGAYTSSTSVQFNWTAATDTGSGVASYDLQVGTTPGGSNVFNANAGSSLWSSVSGANGQRLYARVRAKDAAGNTGPWSGNSNGILIDTVPPTTPGKPRDKGAFTSSTAVRFDWTAATDSGSGMASYDLQVGASPGASNVFNANVGNVLARTITAATGQTLYARVRGRDRAGNAGPWSASSDGILVDTVRPRLIAVTARDCRTVLATFDEPVVNADRLLNYGATGGLRILGVTSLSAAQYQVATTDQIPGTSYTLTVNSAVQDRASNTINPASCSRAFVGGRETGVGAWRLYR